ncbi:HAD family hydrolase [Nitratifractor salsuginis]|uniref:phosphoglycolate phosphatase n=1 Tax=Nitratifractor salsuginis (strain DSM 16511 / JCM 12458 / E9I37-1) TaxID=749222 RepID=E6X284_NITSE|nr:HAD family hydrolase [Nitratifractor salsuginis]ADV46019.1 HAD-superfamily hydrolase, subfamily IA, variant 3 [Nitratifractor salsuginis DSM 16511]
MATLRKRLAIFDMDGTLVDSSLAIANAINFVRSRLGLPPLPREEIISRINDPHLNAAEYFYATDHFEVRHEEWFSEYYSAHHQEELRLYPGILELLEWLKGQGCLLAVATNAYRRSALETLEHLGISDYFDAVASYDDVERGKPAPDMLVKILEELKVSREEAIFIGDGPRDAMAAEAAGIEFILVQWGFSDHRHAVESVEELRSILERRCQERSSLAKK